MSPQMSSYSTSPTDSSSSSSALPPPCQCPSPRPHLNEQIPAYSPYDRPASTGRLSKASSSLRMAHIPHPYARLYAKKEEVKRRKIWNHALEKSLFSPYELSTIGAPQRRKTYTASLEAHIDRLHAQLIEIGFFPVDFGRLEPYKGLNSKTAKSMVIGLQHNASIEKLKLLELERANSGLEYMLRISEATQENMSPGSASFLM